MYVPDVTSDPKVPCQHAFPNHSPFVSDNGVTRHDFATTVRKALYALILDQVQNLNFTHFYFDKGMVVSRRFRRFGGFIFWLTFLTAVKTNLDTSTWIQGCRIKTSYGGGFGLISILLVSIILFQ